MNNPYYKKTVDYKLGEHDFKFNVSQELFSSQIVDHGTQRLLRTLLFEKIDSFEKALDLGCGYGPIGIALKKICPGSEVHMTDRDALAVSYTLENAKLNGVNNNISVYGSLGYDSVNDVDFDLIVSNIPAKVGEHVLTHMIKDARLHLRENGKVIIVVIDAINDYVHQELVDDESIEITYSRSWPGHYVYHYRFVGDQTTKNQKQSLAFERGEYARENSKFKFRNTSFNISTTFHLPEFNKLSYDTNLLLSSLESFNHTAKNVLIINPGQGYVPVAISHALKPSKIVLVDRDLQALKVSRENLVANGYDESSIAISHQVGISVDENAFDLVVGILPEKQNVDVYKQYISQAHSQLRTGALLLLCSSSTVITRVEDVIYKKHIFETISRIKKKGLSTILLRKLN